MALVKCSKCGAEISEKAKSCPQCGAKPKRMSAIVKYGGGFVAAMFLLAVAVTLTGKTSTETPKEAAEVPVDFDRPLETVAGTLVCPPSAVNDSREGRGYEAAMKSRNEIFGRREDAEKAGCEEWRAGKIIHLAEEDRLQAKELQAHHQCGMLYFGNNLIYSCELKNSEAPHP